MSSRSNLRSLTFSLPQSHTTFLSCVFFKLLFSSSAWKEVSILISPGKYFKKYGRYRKIFQKKIAWFRGDHILVAIGLLGGQVALPRGPVAWCDRLHYLWSGMLSSCDGSTVPSDLAICLERIESERRDHEMVVFGLPNIELEDLTVTCDSLGITLSPRRLSLPFESQPGMLLVVDHLL